MRLLLFLHTVASSSETIHLWPAVIEVYNMSESMGGSIPDHAFSEISDFAIHLWQEFNASGVDRNHQFFKWQESKDVEVSSTWIRMTSSAAYRAIVAFVTAAAVRYVGRMSLDPHPKLSMVSWAAVQQVGGYHDVHTHTGDSVVCVLYARVGKQSGNLMFHDPRGYNPPFGRSRIHQVQTGQLILFPSWMPHSVLPSRETEHYRVIFAFNFGSGKDDSPDFQVKAH